MPSEKSSGSEASNTSISLLNLASNLPIGVTSKNANGALIMAHNMSECKDTAAFSVPNRGTRSHTIDAMADEYFE